MTQTFENRLPQRWSVTVLIALVFAGTLGMAQAADVQVNTPPSGNFVVKDHTGSTTLLQVQESGPVTVPNLSTAPTYSTGVCSDAGGVLGKCADAASEYADFYALMPPDNAATVAPGVSVQFPQDGPNSGTIVRTSPSTFQLPSIGTYQVMFQVSVVEAGQLVITLNSTELASTVVGRATGTSQIVGISLVQTSAANSILSVNNPSGSSIALTITPLAGGVQPVSAHLVITRLR